MSTPNFRRGVPPTPTFTPNQAQAKGKPKVWLAKYDGTCSICSTAIDAGIDRVQWNAEGTAVVHGDHRV